MVFVPDILVLDASHIHCVRQFNHYAMAWMGRAKAFAFKGPDGSLEDLMSELVSCTDTLHSITSNMWWVDVLYIREPKLGASVFLFLLDVFSVLSLSLVSLDPHLHAPPCSTPQVPYVRAFLCQSHWR